MITYADLTPDQQKLYLSALVASAKSDDALDQDEIDFYMNIATHMGVEDAEARHILEQASLDMASVPPLHNAVGALILRDAAAMAVINNVLLDTEEVFIFRLGDAMQFSKDEIEEFLNWAFMGLQWQLKSASLLEKYTS